MRPRIDVASLREYVEARDRERGYRASRDLRQYAAAIGVLKTLLGHDWVQRRLPAYPDGSFMSPIHQSETDKYKRVARVVELAECIFNFHLADVEGLDHRLTELQSVELEGALGELGGAKFLFRAGIPFRFVVPKQETGCDYDVEAVIDGVVVPCEMKAKVEGMSPSKNGVRTSLEIARRQLPANCDGVIFLRAQLESAGGLGPVARAAKTCIRTSSRVAIVVVHWEQWEMLSNPLDAMKTTAVNWTRCQVIKDPKRTAPHLSLVASPLVNWIDFRRVFESPEETQTRAQTGTMLVQRGSGGVTEYRGSLADLKGRAETAVTAIECDCDELLVLQQQIPIGGAASVSLLSGPARAFQIVRRKEVRPEFQFLFPTAVIDDGLVQGPAGGVFVQPERLQRVRERLNALGPSADMQAFDDEDGVLAVLKQVIHAMRQEGDIGADELVLRNLCVWYQDRVTKETLFEVKYLGRVVRM